MISLKQILVATDLGTSSQHAVRAACELAVQFHAELHLLHVVTYPFTQFVEEWQKDYGRSIDDCEREYKEAAQKAVGNISVAPLQDESTVVRIVRTGFAVPEILDVAENCGADLLVIGTHGHSGLKHILMGSVADLVVRQSPCPVLTVRDPEHRFIPD